MSDAKELILTRFAYHNEITLGRYTLNGMDFATVERQWHDNRRTISCIPIGKYLCEPQWYHKGGYDAMEVRNVPHRTKILFHVGNYAHEASGCILLNCMHRPTKAGYVGVNSQAAFNVFMREFSKEPFYLTIENYAGGVIPNVVA